MNRRAALTFVVGAATLIGFVGMAAALFGSLRPSAWAVAADEVELPIAQLVAGRIFRLSVRGRPVLLLRPTPGQMRSVRRMNRHVWDASLASFKPEIGAFVYAGMDTRLGCELMQVEPGESTLVKYLEPGRDAEWVGGYVDHCHFAASYDLAGRAIRTRSMTYSGFDAELRNLDTYDVRISGGRYVIRMHPETRSLTANRGRLSAPALPEMPVRQAAPHASFRTLRRAIGWTAAVSFRSLWCPRPPMCPSRSTGVPQPSVIQSLDHPSDLHQDVQQHRPHPFGAMQ